MSNVEAKAGEDSAWKSPDKNLHGRIREFTGSLLTTGKYVEGIESRPR